MWSLESMLTPSQQVGNFMLISNSAHPVAGKKLVSSVSQLALVHGKGSPHSAPALAWGLGAPAIICKSEQQKMVLIADIGGGNLMVKPF